MQLDNKQNKIKHPAITTPSYFLYLTRKSNTIYLCKISQDIRQRLSIRPGKE